MPVHTFKRITLCYLIRLVDLQRHQLPRIRNLNIRKCPQQFRLIRMARLDIKLNSTLSPSNRYSESDEKQGVLPRNSKAHQDSKPLNDARDRDEFCLGPGRSSRQRHKRVDLLFSFTVQAVKRYVAIKANLLSVSTSYDHFSCHYRRSFLSDEQETADSPAWP